MRTSPRVNEAHPSRYNLKSGYAFDQVTHAHHVEAVQYLEQTFEQMFNHSYLRTWYIVSTLVKVQTDWVDMLIEAFVSFLSPSPDYQRDTSPGKDRSFGHEDHRLAQAQLRVISSMK